MCRAMNGAPSRAPCSLLLIQHSHSRTAQPGKSYCASFEKMPAKSRADTRHKLLAARSAGTLRLSHETFLFYGDRYQRIRDNQVAGERNGWDRTEYCSVCALQLAPETYRSLRRHADLRRGAIQNIDRYRPHHTNRESAASASPVHRMRFQSDRLAAAARDRRMAMPTPQKK